MAKAHKMETEILKKQLQEMELKAETLEKKLRALRAKKSSQHPEYTPATKNHMQPKTQLESPENSVEMTEVVTPTYFNSTKKTQKRDHTSVANSQEVQT